MNLAEFGRILREAREFKGLSQRELDARTGVSHGYISQIETGKVKSPPSRAVIDALARVVGRRG